MPILTARLRPHAWRRWGPHREGVVKRSAAGEGSWLDVGLDQDAHIPQAVKQGVRLTLAMGATPQHGTAGGQAVLRGALALPGDPREAGGLYWGYATRIAPTWDAMLRQCPFPGGYDLTLGTSGALCCTALRCWGSGVGGQAGRPGRHARHRAALSHQRPAPARPRRARCRARGAHAAVPAAAGRLPPPAGGDRWAAGPGGRAAA